MQSATKSPSHHGKATTAFYEENHSEEQIPWNNRIYHINLWLALIFFYEPTLLFLRGSRAVSRRVILPPQDEQLSSGMSSSQDRATPGPAPVPHLLTNIACACVCFMKCMLEQEGRAFHLPIMYISFPNKWFRDVFLAHSWFSQSTVWLRLQVLQSISSTLGHTAAFPTCPRVTAAELQCCLCKYPSTAMCSGASSWALTRESCSFPWVTQAPGKGRSKTHQS